MEFYTWLFERLYSWFYPSLSEGHLGCLLHVSVGPKCCREQLWQENSAVVKAWGYEEVPRKLIPGLLPSLERVLLALCVLIFTWYPSSSWWLLTISTVVCVCFHSLCLVPCPYFTWSGQFPVKWDRVILFGLHRPWTRGFCSTDVWAAEATQDGCSAALFGLGWVLLMMVSSCGDFAGTAKCCFHLVVLWLHSLYMTKSIRFKLSLRCFFVFFFFPELPLLLITLFTLFLVIWLGLLVEMEVYWIYLQIQNL